MQIPVEPEDWQLKIWRLADRTDPGPGLHEGELVSNSGHKPCWHSEKVVITTWLTEQTQMSWEAAYGRVVAVLSKRLPLNAEPLKIFRHGALRFAAGLFLTTLGLPEYRPDFIP